MDGGEDIRRLLTEIRDTQREHLAEYRKVAERSLEMQQSALARHDQVRGAYRRVGLFVAIAIAALLVLLVMILMRWSRVLFGG